ncbi:hypothetical protein SLS55_010412 [Diplodia seriata]|uniref:Uncharacterized protein n=1 Tax=Diplodia seriata TaxID=420778 RepID=A0ABR3BYG3_9PEZI
MTRMTLKKWLAQPNPSFTVPKKNRPSTHQTQAADAEMDGWVQWKGFSMDEINKLFGPILNKVYDFPNPPSPIQPAHKVIANEDALEFATYQWNVQIVNMALQVVAKGKKYLVWGPKGACKPTGQKIPDLTAVYSDTTSYERTNHIAGDTKMLEPSFPKKSVTQESPSQNLAAKCLKQVLGYGIELGTRYGYMLGPHQLVVIRFSAAPANDSTTTSSIAATRPRRQRSGRRTTRFDTPPPTSRPPRTARSQSPVNSSPWKESPRAGRAKDKARPEVQTVSWVTSKTGLSVCLAMFVIYFCAAVEHEWEAEYPEFSKDEALKAAVAAAAAL